MTKKVRCGGYLQIGGQRYQAISWPEKGIAGFYTLKIRRAAGVELRAEAPLHQCGKGPWKICARPEGAQ